MQASKHSKKLLTHQHDIWNRYVDYIYKCKRRELKVLSWARHSGGAAAATGGGAGVDAAAGVGCWTASTGSAGLEGAA